MSVGSSNPVSPQYPDSIWLTVSPIPAASAVALCLGWMADAFGRDGIGVGRVHEEGLNLVAADPERQSRHLFREGGNIKALAARAAGAPTRVIGLTWIDERQAIVVRPETRILHPSDLAGLRFALPAFGRERGESIARGMALHGIMSALALGGHGLDAARLIEIPAPPAASPGPDSMRRLWQGLELVARGEVDAVYIKGSAAAEAAEALGLVVAIDLDAYPSRLARINNGTPRPIVVHEHMLERHQDLVERFLDETFRAADWAAANPRELNRILARETFSGPAGVELAYRNGFHRSLHPGLSSDRIGMLRLQAEFLWSHGFLHRPVEIDDWIEPAPLEAVLARRTCPKARVLAD